MRFLGLEHVHVHVHVHVVHVFSAAFIPFDHRPSRSTLSLSRVAVRDPHGFVAILEDSVELARDEAFQHNTNFHDREDKVEELMAQVLKKRSASAAAGSVDAKAVVASSTSAAAAL